MRVLSVDVGTTALKMGVFESDGDTIKLIRQYSQDYPVNTYNDGTFSDLEHEKWQKAFTAGCKALEDLLEDIYVIPISGTTPGFAVMDIEGNPFYPAILMLDQRTRQQEQHIIDVVGINKLLEETSNIPVAGGCSLASLPQIKDNLPDVQGRIAVVGHSNTFMGKWLTGEFAIDPPSASLTTLYNTVRNDLTWNPDIAKAFDISMVGSPQ